MLYAHTHKCTQTQILRQTDRHMLMRDKHVAGNTHTYRLTLKTSRMKISRRII